VKKPKHTRPSASKFSVLRQLCNLIPAHLVPSLARETGVDIAFLEKNFRIKRWERHKLAGKAQAQWLWLYATAQAPQRRQTTCAAPALSERIFENCSNLRGTAGKRQGKRTTKNAFSFWRFCAFLQHENGDAFSLSRRRDWCGATGLSERS
jgi:hypothetical protein